MPSIINRRGRPPHPDILTPSEWQVLEGVRAGRTNQEIADHLGVTFHTVKYHISNMLGKLQLEDRQELAGWRPGRAAGVGARRWRAFLPLGGLKVAATAIAGSAAVIGIAGTSILAIRSLGISSKPPAAAEEAPASSIPPAPASVAPPASRADVLASLPESSPGVTVEFTGLSSARTGLRITIPVGESLAGRGVPAARDVVLMAYTATGRHVVSGRSGDYPQDPDPTKWIIELDANPLPPGTLALAMSVGRLEFVSGATGIAAGPTGPWVAVLHVPPAAMGQDLTGRVPPEIDTGFGWRYVIDGVDLVGSELSVTYHAEGNIRDLRPWLLTVYGDATRTVMFHALTPTTATFQVAPGDEAATVRFGAAERQDNMYADPGTGTLESGDWSITIPLN